jgi:hypothetical protein
MKNYLYQFIKARKKQVGKIGEIYYIDSVKKMKTANFDRFDSGFLVKMYVDRHVDFYLSCPHAIVTT